MNPAELIYTGVKYDSQEEVFFAMWLDELQALGYVENYNKVMEPISLTRGLGIPYVKKTQLKTKEKVENKIHTLLRPSEYTPDFSVNFSTKGWNAFLSGIWNDFNKDKLFFTRNFAQPVIFEIKPAFDQQNMERLFVNNQKFIWDKHQIFVNLVEPVELFRKTFLPLQAESYFRYKVVPKKALLKGKKKGDFKFDWEPKTIKQFLCED